MPGHTSENSYRKHPAHTPRGRPRSLDDSSMVRDELNAALEKFDDEPDWVE